MRPVLVANGAQSPVIQLHDQPRGEGIFRPAAGKSPGRVLVVDDEPLIRWSVAESLSDAGFDVAQAADAAGALRSVADAVTPFQVVVLDLRLPDMDDLSLLKTLRQVMPETGLVLMTAFGTAEIVSEARALGASVLDKPFELAELRRVVFEAGAGR